MFLAPAHGRSNHRSAGFQPALACLDPDNDSQNNRQEWIGGSNPTNKLSAFAITSAELSPGGSNIVIHWPTLPRPAV